MKIGDYSAINSSRAERLREEARAAGLDFTYRPRRDPVGTRLWVMGRVDLGSYYKGALAGWGIDQRDPTADRDLVELCLSIPLRALPRRRPRPGARPRRLRRPAARAASSTRPARAIRRPTGTRD